MGSGASRRPSAPPPEPRGAAALPDDDDFEEARRGLVAAFDPTRVEAERRSRGLGPASPTRSSTDEPPDTVNPSLWRQAQLNRIAGLFEVAPGFYQVRGFDLSNMHVIEGERAGSSSSTR